MNETEDEIIYRLYKKGKDNFSDFDVLLIESNPVIKEGLKELFSVDEQVHQEVLSGVEKNTLALQNEPVKKNRLWVPFSISVPAAACFLLLFSYFYYFAAPSAVLGGSVSLFVTPSDNPARFYAPGSTFSGGEFVQLAFQPEADIEEVRQGMVFSIDSNGKKVIYYGYTNQSGPLNQKEPVVVEPVILLDHTIEYIYFFAVFSEDVFNEQEMLDSAARAIQRKKLKAERSLIRIFKKTSFSFIYLRNRAVSEDSL